jgi:hypothetical protein
MYLSILAYQTLDVIACGTCVRLFKSLAAPFLSQPTTQPPIPKTPRPSLTKDKALKKTMAEIAAGVYIASEVIEHGAQAGYAAYLVSKPTLPLKAIFTRIATAADDHTKFVL